MENTAALTDAPMLRRVRFVLVRPKGAVNIGFTARALKNMGIGRLDLVAPPRYREKPARRMSSHAEDLLDRLVVHPDLPAALAQAVLVAAATSRTGQERGPFLNPAQLGRLFARTPGEGELVVVLGPEDHGLSTLDLEHCPLRVTIPADPQYPSLNLAQAAQVLAYELRLAALEAVSHVPARAGSAMAGVEAGAGDEVGAGPWGAGDEDGTGGRSGVAVSAAASRQVMEGFYAHLEQVLVRIGFLNPQNPRHIQRSLRRLFDRAEPDEREVRILRGVLSSVQRLIGE